MLSTILAATIALSPVQPDPAIAKSLGTASAEFTVELLRAFPHDNGNTFFSPYSIQSALWMAGTGAHGKTREEIRKALHLGLDDAAANGFSAVSQIIEDTSAAKKPDRAPANWQPPMLRSANRLWYSGGLDIHKSYTAALEQSFRAQAEKLDFNKPARAAKAINSWVSNVTAGRINQLVSADLIPEQGLVLTNAVYFKAGWSKKFHPLESVDFTSSAGKATKPEGMVEDSSFEYQQLKGAQVVRMHYEGDASMTIILPDAGKMESVLGALDLKTITPRQTARKVVVTMPKFKTAQQSSIAAVLQKLGITTAFDPAAADFEGITAAKPTYISEVIHAANIDVDENGTEAAAATAVAITKSAEIVPSSKPIRFTVDRPFIFYISNTTSGTVLFAGIINDPTSK